MISLQLDMTLGGTLAVGEVDASVPAYSLKWTDSDKYMRVSWCNMYEMWQHSTRVSCLRSLEIFFSERKRCKVYAEAGDPLLMALFEEDADAAQQLFGP